MDKPTEVFKSSLVFGKKPIKSMQSYVDVEWVNTLPIKDGTTVLDVGCFKGRDLRQLWANNPKTILTGLDIQEEAIKYCMEKHEDIGATWIVGNALSLPFADKEFDISYANGLLSDMSPEDAILARAELKRVAKQSFISDCDSNLDFYNEKLDG